MGEYGIRIDIREHGMERPKPLKDARVETLAPYVPRKVVDPVVRHRENAHDPLHQPRQVRASFWPDYEMVMIAHNTEVLEPERVFCLRAHQNR